VSGSHNEVFQHGFITVNPPKSIIGGGIAFAHSYQIGLLIVNPGTITCSGSPAFSGFFAGVREGTISFGNYPPPPAPPTITFSGCGGVTGPKFLAHILGVIDTDGQSTSWLPGSTAGTADSATYGLYQ
jgi:hypothetical protein